MSPPDRPLPADLVDFPVGSLPSTIRGLQDADTPWMEGQRPSAVLMLFIPPKMGDRDARLVLLRRSTQVRSHRGQIGFPGGRRDPDDLTPAATALREAEEELGVPPAKVTLLGALPPKPALDGSAVIPVLGAARLEIEELRLAPAEVDFAFAEPWRLFGRDAGREFDFNIFGVWRRSWVFDAGAYPVWGLTAQILHAAAFAD